MLARKNILTLILASTLVLTINSCTIQKRRYNKGFHIEFLSKNTGKSATHRMPPQKIRSERDDHTWGYRLSPQEVVKIERSYTFKPPHLLLGDKPYLEPARDIGLKKPSSENKVGESSTVTRKSSGSSLRKSKKNSAKYYLGWGLITLFGGVSFMRFWRKVANNITRWASKNILKSQVIIALGELGLISTATWVGYDLGELNHDISSMANYTGISLIGAGLLTMPWFTRKRTVIPFKLNLRRMGFLAIGIGSMLMALHSGNKMSGKAPVTEYEHFIHNVDQGVMSLGSFDQDSKTSESTAALSWRKKMALAASGASTALLILLAFALCIGICLIGFGGIGIVNGLLWAEFGALLFGVLGVGVGVLIVSATIKGMKKVILRDYGIEEVEEAN